MPMADKPPKPSIALPPRSAVDSIFSGGGFSPGPMTLVNNFFYDNNNNDCNSFSQLLAGAMNSPIAAAENKIDWESREGESELGFRQNRPGSIVVAPPQGMAAQQEISPFGFLSPSFFSPLQSPFGMSHQQALAQVTAQAAFSQSYMQMQPPEQQLPYVDPLPHHEPITTSQHVDTVSIMSEPESSAIESPEVTQSERKIVPLSIADKPANDGYNWRKYGQKQVKASEYPRSYYKCTYQNCRVTKKVERNLEGKITEIIYKNQHNHDLPEPSKRTKNSIDTRPNVVSRASPELGLPREIEVSRSIEVSCLAPGRDRLPQLTSVPLTNISNGLEMIEVEPRQNENDDEPYPKRRNIEVEQSDKSSLHKTVTEPKIVLQTRSEVDLLDDGYKWRKYGQKVVKGNPHPRSYYKCTFTGCNVRKHVERSSADSKAVITTYEGKHNHDVPAPRKSNNSVSELKQPQKVMAKKHASNQEMEFSHDQRHLLLQLKEEYTKA